MVLFPVCAQPGGGSVWWVETSGGDSEQHMVVCPKPLWCHSRAWHAPGAMPREESGFCAADLLPCTTGPVSYTSGYPPFADAL